MHLCRVAFTRTLAAEALHNSYVMTARSSSTLVSSPHLKRARSHFLDKHQGDMLAKGHTTASHRDGPKEYVWHFPKRSLPSPQNPPV